MGLVTLFFLIVFTLFYLSKSFEKKPAFLDTVVNRIQDNLAKVSMWGLIYGLVAIVLSPVMVASDSMGVLMRLVANFLIVAMTLPYTLDRILEKIKMNETVSSEIKSSINWITKNEKIIGYIGAAVALLLFAVLFR